MASVVGCNVVVVVSTVASVREDLELIRLALLAAELRNPSCARNLSCPSYAILFKTNFIVNSSKSYMRLATKQIRSFKSSLSVVLMVIRLPVQLLDPNFFKVFQCPRCLLPLESVTSSSTYNLQPKKFCHRGISAKGINRFLSFAEFFFRL